MNIHSGSSKSSPQLETHESLNRWVVPQSGVCTHHATRASSKKETNYWHTQQLGGISKELHVFLNIMNITEIEARVEVANG